MKFYNHYKTIIVSDIPLGASPEYFKKLIAFIKSTSCDKLIFCGDIIKGWQSKQVKKLRKSHNKFLKALFKITERDNTEIIFVTGEEWKYQSEVSVFNFSNISFVSEYNFKSAGNTFCVFPGDLNNLIQKNSINLFSLTNFKYNLLLWINKQYNSYRFKNGMEYRSLFKKFNLLLDREAILYQSTSECKIALAELSNQKECNGIVCGHNAVTGIYNFGGITFLSSGYWSESLTALAESNYGNWEVITFNRIMEEKEEAMKYADITEELFNEDEV